MLTSSANRRIFVLRRSQLAITRAEKEQAVEQLQSDLSKLKLAVMTDYRGLTVAEVTELRAKLREAGVSYRVTKNTLLRLAVAGTPTL